MSGSDEQTPPSRVVAGRYRLERAVGRGGMGVVWLAVDTLIERRVALKELRGPAGGGGSEEASFVERALREARNAGRLNHPGVVAVHDVIAPTGDDHSVYIVMEYVEAPTLGDLIDRQGPLPAPRVAAMGAGILDALTAAHTMGIVHRDIKPSNVLVRDGDRVKLTDFGIALAAEDRRLTRSGVMGTQAYLAPEAFDSGQVGPAADLWALGATLFHAVAGRAPFERDTATATLRAILFEDPPVPPCPPPLAEVITRLLTRSVEQRLTGDAARQELARAAAEPAGPPPTAGPQPTGGTGQGGWEAQATNIHRPPAATPTPYGTTQPSWAGGQTTQPGGQPSPYVTAQPAQPTPPPAHRGPAGFIHPGSGPGLPPQTAPTTGPMPGASWVGSPPRRNNTPWVVGGLAVAAALLLIVVLASSGGPGSDEDGGSGGGTEENAFALEFLDAINSGDENTAIGMLCPERGHPEDLTDAITRNASLDIDPATVETEDPISFLASLVGTVDGVPIEDAYISVLPRIDETGWCIYRFDLGESLAPSGQ